MARIQIQELVITLRWTFNCPKCQIKLYVAISGIKKSQTVKCFMCKTLITIHNPLSKLLIDNARSMDRYIEMEWLN